MTPGELRAFCLSFNAAVEDFPFGPEISVFKVRGRCSRCPSWTGTRSRST